MTRSLDRDRFLEELERDCRPAPSAGDTRLVTTAHALRRRPIGEPTVEDMRLSTGQDIGLPCCEPRQGEGQAAGQEWKTAAWPWKVLSSSMSSHIVTSRIQKRRPDLETRMPWYPVT